MAEILDVSGLEFYMPIFAFLFVFVIMYALIAKTKILGDNKFVNLVVSFVIAVIFTLISSIRTYIETVIPWFAVLIVLAFFALLIVHFVHEKPGDILKPWFAWVFVALLVIIFLAGAIIVFPDTLEPLYDDFTDWADGGGIAGGIILLVVAIIAAWVLAKS
ncbi:MAG: hypothetical protein ABIE22_04455 [archaeon]